MSTTTRSYPITESAPSPTPTTPFPVEAILMAEDARRRAIGSSTSVERRHQPQCNLLTRRGLCNCSPALVAVERLFFRD